jgi:tetratricopeptide (TPR) repeat protein
MLLFAACTTTKSTSDISKWQRFYHNLTGQYNGYFNANEIIELSVENMQTANQDNYTQLLPIFPYTGNYDAASYNENLDKAITKVTTTATIHEKGQWVDDSYVLMGKAQYLKKDYESAEETFEYFKEEFDFSRYHTGRQKSNARLSRGERAKERKKQQKIKKAEKKERDKEREEDAKERDAEKKERDKTRKQEMKERAKAKKKQSGSRERAAANVQWEDPALEKSREADKKEEEDKEEDKEKKEKEAEEKKEEKALKKSNRKHTPAFYEGLLWLAKTYSERERFASAEYLFNSIDDEDDAPKEVKQQIPLSRARMYLVKKDYDKTIENLDLAISLEKDKKLKARYSYIKAQIYTQMNEPGQALQAYEKVKKYNPDFVMEFNADLNKIILRNQTGSANTKSSLKTLNRMLKEDKYATYQGQIYYAIGQINYQDGNIGEAIANYKNSLDYNSGNLFQKTESYYKLASLYFDTDDYAQAKYYYDSTLIFMPKTDYRFDQTTVYSNSLNSIAKNIEIIDTQDSLLAMGAMSSDEQRAYAIETLDNQGAKSDPANRSFTNPTFQGSTGSIRMNATSFFAYNVISLQRGQKSFTNEWGGRQLQDNWRTISDSDSSAGDSEDLAVSDYSDQQIESVLRTLPKTQAQRDLASMKKQEAMFELGKLYREKLKNPEAGFAMHQKLYQDNPDFKPQEELLYYLYLSGIDSNKRNLANKYKKKLINQYPDSDFAKILTDPGYAKTLMEKEKAPIKYYDETYALFEAGNYKQVIARAAKAPDILQDDKALRAKMELINAISIGKEQGKAKYLMALNKVIKTYPNTEEERRATEMKRFLSGDETAFNELLFDEDSDVFKEDFDKLHYGLVVIFDASSKVIQDMRLDINRFHKKYFSLEQLSTQTIPLSQEDNIKLILVRSFNDQSKAMDYFNVIDEKDKEFIKKKGYSFELFVINQNNYREIIKKRSINEYRLFFENNYQN